MSPAGCRALRRLLIGLAVAAGGLAGAGCVGGTDPATKVSTLSAQLNAHGFTDDGPATWWWEYATSQGALGTAGDTEVCGFPPEADKRCGPAESPSEVQLNVRVTGLTPATTYYFRACGQDAGESPACGAVKSFTTLAGTSYVFDAKWGTEGSGDGQFQSGPFGIDTDALGNVYTTDTGLDRVQKFTPDGTFVTKWGSTGTGNSQFNNPRDVHVDAAGNVYVADLQNSRISKFTSGGAFLQRWGTQGSGNGQFDGAYGVTTDAAGNVYAADVGNDRVQKFTSLGSFLLKWGTTGTANGQFQSPDALSAGPGGGIAVAEQGPGRIQVFGPTGTFLYKFGASGTNAGEFQTVVDVETDSAGRIYTVEIVDPGRVQVFNSLGGFVTLFGDDGGDDGQFAGPRRVAADPFGNLLVADAGNDRVQRFRPVE